jgi:hypothetical protein
VGAKPGKTIAIIATIASIAATATMASGWISSITTMVIQMYLQIPRGIKQNKTL